MWWIMPLYNIVPRLLGLYELKQLVHNIFVSKSNQTVYKQYKSGFWKRKRKMKRKKKGGKKGTCLYNPFIVNVDYIHSLILH